MQKLLSKLPKHAKDGSMGHTSQRKKPHNHPRLFRVDEQNNAYNLTTGDGFREPKVTSVVELGNVLSKSTYVKRDLGFQGKLGRHVVLTYGDTMFSDATGCDEFRGMTCNSAAIAGEDPTVVLDPALDDNNYPRCLLRPNEEDGEDPSKYSLGLTNIIETSPAKGILYFLLNHRPEGKDNLLGAGVAEVILEGSEHQPVPKARRLSRYWWNGETEPWYGDVCALKTKEHVYAYGHAKDSPFVYLTRAKLEEATILEAYEYWNGDTWQRDRLKRENLTEKQSIFWQVNQGQVFWSRYHDCFMFIYCDNFWSCQVLAKVSLSPQGPWSDPVTIYKPKPVQNGGNVYAAIPHPYFDTSCKTLVITYTNHPNTIQAIRVEFE